MKSEAQRVLEEMFPRSPGAPKRSAALSQAFSKPGKKMEKLGMEWTRDLGEEDIEEMVIFGAENATTPKAVMTRIRQVHHYLARLSAEGKGYPEMAAKTGLGRERIQCLHSDPAFMELVEHYKEAVEDQYKAVHQKIAVLGEAVVDELNSRLEEAPEKLSVSQLLEIGKMALDRNPETASKVSPAGGLALPGGAPNQGFALNIQFVASPHANAALPERPKEMLLELHSNEFASEV